jgi:hypothetical protein
VFVVVATQQQANINLCTDVHTVVFMALRTRARETGQVEFREVGITGVFIAHTVANRENSINLLQQNGFRALTYQEALIKIDQNPELKKQLQGRWLYLDGKGTELSGFYIFNEKGELTKIAGPAILKKGQGDLEKIVFVLKGSQPLSLLVQTDDFARYGGFRFGIYGTYGHSDVAGVVVGVHTEN